MEASLTYSARTIAQYYLRTLCCGYVQLPRPRPQPRLHRPLDRSDHQRARQPDEHVRVPAARPTSSPARPSWRRSPRPLTCSACRLALLPAGVLADRLDRLRLMRLASATGRVALRLARRRGACWRVSRSRTCCRSRCSPGSAPVSSRRREISAVRAVVPDEDLPTALSPEPGAPARRVVARRTARRRAVRRHPLAAVRGRRLVVRRLLRAARPDPRRPVRAPSTSPRSRPLQELPRACGSSCPARSSGCCSVGAAVNLVVNAVFFVAVLRLIESGVAPARTRPGRDRGRRLRHPRRAGRAVADRPVRDRPADVCGLELRPAVVPMVFWNHPAVVALALASACSSTPPATPASAPTASRSPPRELQGRVQAADAVRRRCPPCRWHPCWPAALLADLGGGAAIAVWSRSAPLVALIPTLSRSVRAVPRPAVWRPRRRALPGVAGVEPRDVTVASRSSSVELAGPDVGVGVDHREVVAADLDELGRAAGGPGGRDVVPGLADRDDVVVAAVHAPDRYVERDLPDRVDIGVVGPGRMAQERLDRAAAEAARRTPRAGRARRPGRRRR